MSQVLARQEVAAISGAQPQLYVPSVIVLIRPVMLLLHPGGGHVCRFEPLRSCRHHALLTLRTAACMKWRIESGVEEVFSKGEEGLQHGEGFLRQMTTGKCYLHGSDRHERPVLYVHAAMHRTSEQSPRALEEFVMFQVRDFDRQLIVLNLLAVFSRWNHCDA